MQTDRSGILRIEGVTFAYPGGHRVLDRLDFSVSRGERVGLVGPNGCGKTTLFHLIVGLVRPESGKIRVFGKEMAGEKDFREVRRKVGFLFQNSDDQLFCPTVLEDVAFGPLNLGKSPAEAVQAARKTLLMLGIPDFELRICHKISHGEKKLVALAGVLAMEPEVLILDEPTAGLDKATRERLLDILAGLDLTCIVASHEMDFLSRVTGVLYGMADGKIDMTQRVMAHSHVHLHTGGQYQHSHEDPFKAG
jgi:cobalt/nickel transport system ATP-binding protein